MIPSEIKQFLTENKLEALEFDEGSTPTAATAAKELGVEVGQIAKSLLFKRKNGDFFMIVCAGDRRIDAKKIKALLGMNSRMATAEELKAQTSFSPGEVCPFCVEGPEIFLDRSLEAWPTVYPAAGTDSSAVPVTPARLKELINVPWCDVCL